MFSDSYKLITEAKIVELDSIAKVYQHLSTKAKILSLENSDTNKVFSVNFRTPIVNSTGVPHILEHSVLCGSKKYPTKEPFVELMKASLSTFLNAFTYPDKTCYPVASQNEQDFLNLVEVYLDSVFFPLISEKTFLQEGWHYHLEDFKDPLTYKGVVFNEMKGNYSSPINYLYRLAQRELFPENTYNFCSGGDPTCIPNLSYKEFKSFHENFYHPSNAWIYFYGDLPLEQRFSVIDNYLSKFSYKAVNSKIELQKSFSNPKKIVEHYDAPKEETKSFLMLNWLIEAEATPLELMEYDLLNYLLLGSAAAPLRKILLESNLGEGLIGGGFSSDLRQVTFSIGMTGVEVANQSNLEKLIIETIKSISFDNDLIAAGINSLEFGLREQNTGGFPKGLALMLRALTGWLHDRDPIEYLEFSKNLEYLKGNAKSQDYFSNMVVKVLGANQHKVLTILNPKVELTREIESKETELLKQHRNKLSEQNLKDIQNKTIELLVEQSRTDSDEDLSKIPRLKIDQLDRVEKAIPTEILDSETEKTIYHHDLQTNDIVYLDLALDYSALSNNLIPYLSLLPEALIELGTKFHSASELAKLIDQYTGGIVGMPVTLTDKSSTAIRKIIFKVKCISDKTNRAIQILHEILKSPNFSNKERFISLVRERKAGIEAALVPSGHSFAFTRLQAKFSETGQLLELLSGVSQYLFLKELERKCHNDWQAVEVDLNQLHSLILKHTSPIYNLTLPEKTLKQTLTFCDSLQELFLNSKYVASSSSLVRDPDNELYKIPANVNFVASAANLYNLGFKFTGANLVIQNIIRNNILWNEIRVKGGAYGAYNSFDRFTGIQSFTSYRDPNVSSSLKTFENIAKFISNNNVSEAEIEKNIIGTIADIDAYKFPDAKGYTALIHKLLDINEDERQKIRTEVLECKKNDLQSFAEMLVDYKDQAKFVVLGNEDTINQAKLGMPLKSIL